MRSRSTKNIFISVGDIVEIFVKHDNEKRGKWLSPRTMLSFDPASCTGTDTAGNGKTMCAAIEDVRPAIVENSFASVITKANDELEGMLDETY